MSVFAITAGNHISGEINGKRLTDIKIAFAGEGDNSVACNRNDRLVEASFSDFLASPIRGQCIRFPVPGKYDTIDIGACQQGNCAPSYVLGNSFGIPLQGVAIPAGALCHQTRVPQPAV